MLFFLGILISIILLVVIVGLWVMTTYNGLTQLRLTVKESASDIETLLKKRFDLIPNLVNTVKGYMTHEKETFEKITELRSQMGSGPKSMDELSSLNNQMTSTLKTLFAVSESYPELKADTSFIKLQVELSELESEIQKSRRFYNATVGDYNTRIAIVPNVFVANYFKFMPADFFAAEEQEKQNVTVQF